MAPSLASEHGISVDQAKQDILDEWRENLKDSSDKGDYIHDGLENWMNTGKHEEDMKKPVDFLAPILKEYYHFYPEVLLHSHDYKLAGKTDLILQRQKSKDPVFDFLDYKTNMKKGICYDSIKRVPEIKHYNRYLLPPFEYLEDCNYNIYCLQLSLYAFMAMNRLNLRIGKLQIIFFDNNFDGHIIPVPFMFHEAKVLCEMNITRKQLPCVIEEQKLDGQKIKSMIGTESVPFPETVVNGFDPKNVTEDW
jgi:hypothetical protein